MISDVDNALAGLLRREVLDSARVSVVFDPPTKEWAAKRNGPAVNLFLYDIREDTRRRASGAVQRFGENGRLESRHTPPRIFRLFYLVSAWTQRPEDEHRLLGALLESLLGHDVVPADLLPTSPSPVGLSVGLPPDEDRSFADVWSALGGELRPSIDVVLSLPLEAGRAIEVGPPVEAPLRLDMSAADGETNAERVGGDLEERREAAAGNGQRMQGITVMKRTRRKK